ncbi:unnamed protein product [Staurois parvus]|uniref:Uncharacterized protein n=1 Tax=Staurois parvus TaxID=386267 RepID=A0ABN9E824_9NEOB|nr:unnamed protein product [Staurois parvus]
MLQCCGNKPNPVSRIQTHRRCRTEPAYQKRSWIYLVKSRLDSYMNSCRRPLNRSSSLRWPKIRDRRLRLQGRKTSTLENCFFFF